MSHVLSTEIVGILLVLTCIIFCKRLFTEKRYLYIIKAAGLTLLLSAWFLIPFITEFSKVGAVGGDFTGTDIDKTGTFLAQLFMTFPAIGPDARNEYAIKGINGEMSLSVGLPILFAVCLVVITVYTTRSLKVKKRKDVWFLLFMGVLLMILCNHRFPWDSIAGFFAENHITFVGKMINSIQFIWRLVGFAVLLLCAAATLGLDCISSEISRRRLELMLALILLAGAISAFHYNDNFMYVAKEMRVYSEEGVNGDYGDTIYLPIGSSEDHFRDTFYPYTISGTGVDVVRRQGQTMTLKMRAGESAYAKAADSLILPYIYYDGYAAKDDVTGEKYEVYCTEDYNVGIRIPANYTGQITISYKGKWYWRIGELMSLATCGYLLIRVCIQRRKKRS